MIDKPALTSYLVNGCTALFGFLTVEYIAIAIGVFLGVLTYCTTLYYHRLRNARDVAEQARKVELHELEVEALRAKT